ncbi:hypothetical protein [Xenophilus azovorans]|uniref:hypothetical protein n=1 Tax=Xenophilus azovorans TaxID=151755 RepID=UPI00056FFE9A|nr:hypothetical protein [Xenophilus azovorans]
MPLTACAALAWLLYAQARGMTWQFDDLINLRTLAGVSTHAGLVDFVFGGVAGPSGRPLSLLTFVANYDDWTGNPWGVSRLNLLLHGFNGMLVFLLMRRLFVRVPSQASISVWLATAAAALWMLLPIHASSILMPVQRMTQVSAFFTLFTLYAYVALRARYTGTPSVAGIFWLSLCVGIGTLLSVLGKENGAITAALVALIELFFFERSPSKSIVHRVWRLWIFGALLLVPVALAYHLVTVWDGIQGRFIHYRGYSMVEHVATQAVISWEYVRQILLPRAALLGPYHDGHAVYGWTMWQPYAALIAWLALLVVGLALIRHGHDAAIRRLGKFLLFAIVWFFACHQIESTVIPLELYFEHRNYLAALGPCFFLVSAGGALWALAQKRKLVLLVSGAVLAVQIFALQQITSLWGQPMLANEMWVIHNPGSTRATQALANDYLRLGFRAAALRVSDEFAQTNNAIDVAIQFFPKHCSSADAHELQTRFAAIQAMIPVTKRPGGIPTGIAAMGNAIRKGECAGISRLDYIGLLGRMLDNASIRWNPAVRHHLNYEMALTQMEEGDVKQYAAYAQRAFLDFPSLSIAQAVALNLFSHGELERALEWVNMVLAKAPNKIVRKAWTEQLGGLRSAMLDIQRQLDHASMEVEEAEKEGAR